MEKSRLLGFSDGVIAIIITIMVLELKAPQGADLGALVVLGPVFLSYVLSFLYVAIYWHNHHHLSHVSFKVDGQLQESAHLSHPFQTSVLTAAINSSFSRLHEPGRDLSVAAVSVAALPAKQNR